MPTDYLWLMGASGVGKATLQARLAADSELRARFGIRGTMRLRGPAYGTPGPAERAEDLATLVADHVVIEWQLASDAQVGRLRALRPDAGHRIVLLTCEFEEHLRRIRQRSPE